MKNTRDELMEEYSKILTATDGKSRPMTPEEYKELERGVYTSSGESEWSGYEELWPSDAPEMVYFDPKMIAPKPEPETAPELKPDVVSGEGAEFEPTKIESPSGWPKKIKLPDGTTETFRSPEEWQESVKERSPTEEPKELKELKNEALELMTEMKTTVEKLEHERERKIILPEAEKNIKKIKEVVTDLEELVEEIERRKTPTVQSGEIERKT